MLASVVAVTKATRSPPRPLREADRAARAAGACNVASVANDALYRHELKNEDAGGPFGRPASSLLTRAVKRRAGG